MVQKMCNSYEITLDVTWTDLILEYVQDLKFVNLYGILRRASCHLAWIQISHLALSSCS